MDVPYVQKRVCNKKNIHWIIHEWIRNSLFPSFLPSSFHFFSFFFLTRLPVVNSNEIHRFFLTKAMFLFTVLRCSGKNLGKGSLGEKKEIFSFRFGTNASNKQHLARNKKNKKKTVRPAGTSHTYTFLHMYRHTTFLTGNWTMLPHYFCVLDFPGDETEKQLWIFELKIGELRSFEIGK